MMEREHIELAAQDVRSAISRMIEIINTDTQRAAPELDDMHLYGSALVEAATLAKRFLKAAEAA